MEPAQFDKSQWLDKLGRVLSKLKAWSDQHTASGRPLRDGEREALAKIQAMLAELKKSVHDMGQPPTR